ncbi:MAG: hypothetical protein ACT6S0_19445, partial [Roseateles sp.]|uniref:hypothetical protein n=1 Tax=Roseateles sp. TaxID=1971397 RepID=UPI004035ED86
LAERVRHRCIAGSPPRQAGNFLLRGQKKTEGFGEAKVTPPPGGTPGTTLAINQEYRGATQKRH